MVFSCKLTIPVVLIYQYNRIKNSIEWYIETTPYRANKWVSHPNIGCFLCNMCSISSMWQTSTNRSCIKTCNPYLFTFPPLNHRWAWLCLYDIRQKFAMIKSYTCSYITKQTDRCVKCVVYVIIFLHMFPLFHIHSWQFIQYRLIGLAFIIWTKS